jgi:serine/threonine protein kinase/tetratricopeptide (TPR) repeat protein
MRGLHDFAGNQRFEVLTRLGQGGMGAVYQVIDRSRNVRVALKSVGCVSGDSLLRFKREYRTLQEIHHPNLVELGELFEMEQSWFFTMELIDGADFLSHVRTGGASADNDNARATARIDEGSQDALSGRPLAPSAAGFSEARLRRGLAGLVSGVAALHARGLMHRDLKPANVLVTDEGRVVLIDFGLVTDVERSHSTEIHIMGTVAYMSPEQAAQELAGPASDWYSVGVILYECLTGRLPIDDSHLRLLLRKQREVPPSPRSLVPDVPGDLDALCMALLEIDPRRRPSVQEIYRRLHVDAEVPERRPSTSLSVAGLPELFVGRTRELELLSLAFADSAAGLQRTVSVVGPSGVGKSALLRRFQAELDARGQGPLVLSGQCREHETVPYKALDGVMDALSKWLKAQPAEVVRTLLPADTWLLVNTFTVLERVPSVRSAPRATRMAKDPQEMRLALLSAVRELFRRIAERFRTVLILEDMQWSDDDSFHLLRELTRAPEAPPLLIVYSRQPRLGERAHLDPAAQDEIVLKPLDRDEALDLVRRIRPLLPELSLRRMVDQAEGYPFLLEALAQPSSTSRDAGPQGTEDVLERLYKSLSGPSRALLEVISLAGFPITKRLAAEAAGVAPEDLASEIKVLRTARWIRTGGPLVTDLVAPSHDRVRRIVLDELGTARCVELHRTLAMGLEEMRAEPEKIAHHYLLAGDARKAALHFRSAAERALAALAFDHAAALLRQRIDLCVHEPEEEKELYIALGEALASAGRGLEAARAYESAIPHCSGMLALDLKRRIAEQYLINGRYEDGMVACASFLGAFGVEMPATPRRALLELVVLRARVALRGQRFKIRQAEQVSREELAHIDALWSVAKSLATNDILRAQVFQTRGLLRALAAGEPYRVSRALSLEYVNLLVENPAQRKQADRLLERATELATDLDDPHARGLTLFCKGFGAFAGLCQFADGLESLAHGMGILRTECSEVGSEVYQGIMMVCYCHMQMGNWRALREEALRGGQEAAARGDLYLTLSLRTQILTFVHLVDDRPEVGAEELAQALNALGSNLSPLDHFLSQIANLRLLQYRGRATESLAAAVTSHGLVDKLVLGTPIVRLMADETHLHNALLAVEVGLDREAHLKRATRVAAKLERDGIPAGIPSGHLGRAAIAHARGDTPQALAWLERAERGFVEQNRDAHAAAARRRRGQLLDSEEGQALVSAAERWFVSEGTRNVPAMCRLLAPGFAGLGP